MISERDPTHGVLASHDNQFDGVNHTVLCILMTTQCARGAEDPKVIPWGDLALHRFSRNDLLSAVGQRERPRAPQTQGIRAYLINLPLRGIADAPWARWSGRKVTGARWKRRGQDLTNEDTWR